MLGRVLRFSLAFLFIWFLLDIIGVPGLVYSLGLVSIESLWLLLLSLFIMLYLFKESVGKWLLEAFLVAWVYILYANNFKGFFFGGITDRGIKKYNEIFLNTHHIIPMSDKKIVPDTYHIILILLVLTCSVLILLLSFVIKDNKNQKNSINGN